MKVKTSEVVIVVTSVDGTRWKLLKTRMAQLGGMRRLASRDDIAKVFTEKAATCDAGFTHDPLYRVPWDVERYHGGSIRVGCKEFAASQVAKIRKWAKAKNGRKP
jgi:hypothetical protein